MRNFLILIIVTLFNNSVNAQTVYLDINYILNTSEIGKSLNTYLKKLNDINVSKFKKIELDIINKEKSLISKKNIISKSEFEKKLSDLSIEVKKYRNDKKITKDKVENVKLENTKKILNELNPIITEYVEKNSISLVIPKKNIIIGKKELDITNQILILLNKKIKKLEF